MGVGIKNIVDLKQSFHLSQQQYYLAGVAELGGWFYVLEKDIHLINGKCIVKRFCN